MNPEQRGPTSKAPFWACQCEKSLRGQKSSLGTLRGLVLEMVETVEYNDPSTAYIVFCPHCCKHRMHRLFPIDSTPHRGAPRAHNRLFRLRTTFTENSRSSTKYIHVWLFRIPRSSRSSRILCELCPEAIGPKTLDSIGIPHSISGGYSPAG